MKCDSKIILSGSVFQCGEETGHVGFHITDCAPDEIATFWGKIKRAEYDVAINYEKTWAEDMEGR